MLSLLGTIIGLLFIIIFFSNGLQEKSRPRKSKLPDSSGNNKKAFSSSDMHLLAKILSVGLVDADPNYLHHLKGYRDLQYG